MGPPDPSSGNVRALRRVRVLVAARDRRFVAAAMFVLTRRGFLVEATRPSDVLATVQRTAPDVVVLDGSGALASAGRIAAAVEGEYPGTSVVLVSENHHHAASTLPKWKAFARLIEEIEGLYGIPPSAREAI
jgi:chemotaxis response regulator CheB